MKRLKALILGLSTAVVMGSMAMAADLPSTKSPQMPLFTQESFNPWMIRARVIGVFPVSSGKVYNAGTLLNGGLNVSNSVVPELDISYFFTKISLLKPFVV